MKIYLDETGAEVPVRRRFELSFSSLAAVGSTSAGPSPLQNH